MRTWGSYVVSLWYKHGSVAFPYVDWLANRQSLMWQKHGSVSFPFHMEFQVCHKVVCQKILAIPHGSVRCHMFWWQLSRHSYLAIISGLSVLFEIVLLGFGIKVRVWTFAYLLTYWALFRVVNDTLESISVELGFNGSTLAEGAHNFNIVNEIFNSYTHRISLWRVIYCGLKVS